MAKAKSLKTRAKPGIRKSMRQDPDAPASTGIVACAATPNTFGMHGAIAPLLSLPAPVGRPTSPGRKSPAQAASGMRQYKTAKLAA